MFLILGGGISGLGAAWRLSEKGIPVNVLEVSPSAGGLAGTVREGAYALDFGPHSFFTEDAEISETVKALFPEGGLKPVPRDVQFYFRGKYLNYPFTPSDLLLQLGPAEAFGVLTDFIRTRFQKKTQTPVEDLSVEEWALSSFGPRMYQSFFKPYTEQFWKIPCSELSARSIPSHTRLSFLKTLRHLLGWKPSSGAGTLDREKLPTSYPSTGYGEIAEKIEMLVNRYGGKIHCSAEVTEIQILKDHVRVSYVQKGEIKRVEAEKVISTLPLPVLFPMLKSTVPDTVREAAAELDYRPLLFLGMVTRRQNILPCSYMYVLDRPYNRLTEMNRFSPLTSPEGENILGVEIPCRPGDDLWNASPELLFEHCAGALKQDGILERGEVQKLLLAKAHYAYPIYKKNYARFLSPVLQWIQDCPRLETLGRSGEFRYMDADQCLRRSFDLAGRMTEEVFKKYETAKSS